jgi:tRNA 2-thiocytidine biosynthesis protein TtcA
MKQMLSGWDKQFPGRLESIFTSLKNVAPSQLADTKLFDFKNLAQEQFLEQSPPPDNVGLDILSV